MGSTASIVCSVDAPELEPREETQPETEPGARLTRPMGLIGRGLHLDELGGIVDMTVGTAKAMRAFWRGTNVARRSRLDLVGYEPVQESSFWALPLAEGLEWWGVDRQLGRLDYRQGAYFRARRRDDARIWIVAPDPAIAFGEPWEFGEKILAACGLSMQRDRVLYQCGDMHQYERRLVGASMHVIAGGGGAFLHGTRIVRDPTPAVVAYPSAKISRRLALQVPFKLMLGRAGYLVHIAAALVASIELAVGWRSRHRFLFVSLAVSALVVWLLYTLAGHRRAHPRRVLLLSIPFGVALGSLPLWITVLLRHVVRFVPALGRDVATVIVCAFVGALLFGVFLAICALRGFEMQQVFTVLGHPGFKHFVRLRVGRDGTIDAWAIGKDDPLAKDGPWLVDRWTWR